MLFISQRNQSTGNCQEQKNPGNWSGTWLARSKTPGSGAGLADLKKIRY